MSFFFLPRHKCSRMMNPPTRPTTTLQLSWNGGFKRGTGVVDASSTARDDALRQHKTRRKRQTLVETFHDRQPQKTAVKDWAGHYPWSFLLEIIATITLSNCGSVKVTGRKKELSSCQLIDTPDFLHQQAFFIRLFAHPKQGRNSVTASKDPLQTSCCTAWILRSQWRK